MGAPFFIPVPTQAIDLCKRWEGLHKVVQRKPVVMVAPYWCPAHFFTIGFGSLCPKDQQPITELQAELLLARDLNTAMRQTIQLCPNLLIQNQERIAAIVDFTFNLGSGRLKASTLRRRLLDEDWLGAADELRKWVWGGGKKLPGLIARREAEVALLLG